MARQSYNLGGEEVKEESSWRYPLIILITTLALCVVFMYYFFGPDVDELQGNKPRPTIADEEFSILIGDVTLSVPANYTRFPRDRRNGQRETLDLYASWPRMDGYAPARRQDFVENEPDSRRIDILVAVKKTPFTERQRLDILYLPQTIEPAGTPHEHNLTRYTFRQGSADTPASGYSDKEMFTGFLGNGEKVVLFCYPEVDNDAVSPDCYREFDFTDQVSVKYYFKRPYLAEWTRIDQGVKSLLERFREE